MLFLIKTIVTVLIKPIVNKYSLASCKYWLIKSFFILIFLKPIVNKYSVTSIG